jgi:formylglycine-generating enzyme required for sulfatase activity
VVWSVVIPAIVVTACSKKPGQPPERGQAAKGSEVAKVSWPEGVPRELTVDLGRGVKMEFVLIPAGEFMMGDENGRDDEKPVHKVTITKPFYLGKYEVTQEQWEALMGNVPRYRSGPNNRVESVSWEDCQGFMARLNEKSRPGGDKFSLPTEAHWEYACRAGTTTRYSFGDDPASLGDYAWCWLNQKYPSRHPVGEMKPNAWGLYDRHGSASEWCADWYSVTYYRDSPAKDPVGPDSEMSRVFCGGSSGDVDLDCLRSARRFCCHPKDRGAVGFRVARTVTP